MTRIDRSESQLNAEAAERQRKIEQGAEWTPPSYGSESGYRATPSPPPVRRSGQPDSLTLWRAAAFAEPPQRVHQKPTAEMGMDLSEQLTRYIDGSAGHFPVHDALLAWDRVCRRRHQSWYDHPNGRPTCSEMVRLVIFGGASVLYVSERYEVSYPRAERLLRGAASFMRKLQERWLSDTGMSAGHDPEYCAECRRMAG